MAGGTHATPPESLIARVFLAALRFLAGACLARGAATACAVAAPARAARATSARSLRADKGMPLQSIGPFRAVLNSFAAVLPIPSSLHGRHHARSRRRRRAGPPHPLRGGLRARG